MHILTVRLRAATVGILLGVRVGVWVGVRNGTAARKKDESRYQAGFFFCIKFLFFLH